MEVGGEIGHGFYEEGGRGSKMRDVGSGNFFLPICIVFLFRRILLKCVFIQFRRNRSMSGLCLIFRWDPLDFGDFTTQLCLHVNARIEDHAVPQVSTALTPSKPSIRFKFYLD